ncbi:MMPL family transporter [Euzebya tangerina]|uniref:MMPL family transporter n=1 Tax=Euzebya tangerina TaxID=591198 RepID=UPI000E3243E8|nr:MMPL family transporter [Euzebya tangerina]
MRVLTRIGRFSASRPWTVIGIWLVLATGVVGASATVGAELEDTIEVPGVDSQAALDLLEETGATQAGVTAQVVVAAPNGSTITDAASQQEVQRVTTAVEDLDHVVGTTVTIAPAGTVALVGVQYDTMDALDVSDLTALEALVEAQDAMGRVQVEAGGELFFAFDEGETGTAELIGLGAAVVILLLAFGSVIAMGLPIGMAVFGLALGVSLMSLLALVIDVPSFAPQMATMIGLGVGIDYALFLVTRHREHLTAGMSVVEAASRAVGTAGQAVVFAGGTVVIAILGLAVAGLPFMTAAAIATSVIVGIMVLASVTLLPAFLGLAGHRIDRLAIHRRGAAPRGASAGWERWGRHVARRRWTYAIGASVLLVAMAAPLLGLRLGFPDDGTAAPDSTRRQAYDLIAEGFGPGFNGPLLVAMDTAGDDGVVAAVAAAVAADRGVSAVAPATMDEASGVAVLTAIPSTAPQDEATVETIQRLRAEVFPDIVAGTEATIHLGGSTASFVDMGSRVGDRLPAFVAAVVGLSLVVLVAVFRSIWVAVKAAVLNLLSIGAAYGVLVAVFQWGWGLELLGLESTVPIVAFIPMFMFAVLFGLSMDYEVFLLSRVREEYVVSGDNDTAVIRGLAGTARVITSAALIMVAVFGGFVLGNDPIIKMLGLGLATAIAVDATIVRVVLVPATMSLMGDRNWWLPAWLDRLLPHIDLDGGSTTMPDLSEPTADEEDPQPATVG